MRSGLRLEPAQDDPLGNYNLAHGIMTHISNEESSRSGGQRRSSFETEISQEIEKTWRGARHGGLFVPWNMRHTWTKGPQRSGVQKRAGLDSSTATAGQELKFTAPGAFIEFLYNQMR